MSNKISIVFKTRLVVMKNLTSFCIVCLLSITSVVHSSNSIDMNNSQQENQERINLLNKYQKELHELRTKVTQLETEVFLGGYNDLIERYKEIIRQLEYEIQQADSFSKSYSYFVTQLEIQKAEIDDLHTSIHRNNFFLLLVSLFSILALARSEQ